MKRILSVIFVICISSCKAQKVDMVIMGHLVPDPTNKSRMIERYDTLIGRAALAYDSTRLSWARPDSIINANYQIKLNRQVIAIQPYIGKNYFNLATLIQISISRIPKFNVITSLGADSLILPYSSW